MATAKITLLGMHRWMKMNDDDLFELLTVPTGIDKDKLVSTILMNGAEFEVLYSSAPVFKEMIGIWSNKWQNTMKKWADALAIEYNPLENYDRKEDWNENKFEAAVAADNSFQAGSSNTENKKAAYDSSDYENHDKADSGSSGESDAVTNTMAHGQSGHSGRIHGNIGVTTSQQMLQSELDIARFNIYNEISDLFLTELVVYTY